MELIADFFIRNNNEIDNFNRNNRGYIFQFKKTAIVNKFIIGKNDEELKLKFNTLVKIINDSINMEDVKHKLSNFISNLNFDVYVSSKLGFENK